MSIYKRVLIAIVILLFDLIVFVIPVAACIIAYILLVKPAWFKEWVDKLYSDENKAQS